jgi:MFS family permease
MSEGVRSPDDVEHTRDGAAPGTEDNEQLDPRRWIALGVVLFANFMGAMDNFIVNVSAPTIEHHLHASFSQIQLIIASYSLTYGVGLVTGGRLGDIVGRKRMFRIGTFAFTATSLASALAPSASALIGFRLLQGFAAAAMLPQAMSIIQVTFPPRERAKAFGIFGAVNGSSAIAGQVLGGVLIRSNIFGLSWRAVFMVNIPIGIVSLVLSHSVLSETRRGRELGLGTRLDVVGVLLLGPAVFLTINPLARESSDGWHLVSDLQLVAAAILFFAFWFYESRLERGDAAPLIPLHLFSHPSFANGLYIRVLFGWTTASSFLAISYYLQSGNQLTALASGLMFVPLGAGFVFSNLISRRMLHRWWGRVVILGGTCQALGLLAMIAVASLPGGRHLPLLGVAFFLFGYGQGSIGIPINPITMLGLKPKDAGAASGVLLTVSMIASAMGVAVLGTVYIHLVGTHTGHASALETLHRYGHAFAITGWFSVGLSALLAGLAAFLPRSLGAAERIMGKHENSLEGPTEDPLAVGNLETLASSES